MLSVNIFGLKELKKALKNPFQVAMAKALNHIGELIKEEQEKIASKSFRTFSPYTRRSLFFWKTSPSKPMTKQNIVVGTFSPYLAKLEYGFKPKPITIQSTRGRPIASKLSRRPDGTIRPKYTLKKITQPFFLKVRGEDTIFAREGGRLKKLRMMKQNVSNVRAYRWHSRAVNNIYRKGLVERLFLKHFSWHLKG